MLTGGNRIMPTQGLPIVRGLEQHGTTLKCPLALDKTTLAVTDIRKLVDLQGICCEDRCCMIHESPSLLCGSGWHDSNSTSAPSDHLSASWWGESNLDPWCHPRGRCANRCPFPHPKTPRGLAERVG